MFIHRVDGEPFIGVLSQRMSVVIDDERRSLSLYYGRRLNEELLGQIADEVGADVNLYAGGELIASSRAGLLSGGFISPMMDAEAFVEVSLMSVDQSLVTEQAGRYRYEVAYLPVANAGQKESGALGLPLLFRPESFHVEVQKATSVVLSIFALLTAATIGLGLILARGIFEPLKSLLEGTRRISRGDFSVRVSGSHRDEIGTVVEAFNEMTSQLAVSQAALEERRRYLEVILANIATGVISTDADHRIRAINDAAARILGVSATDVMGHRAGDLANAGHVPEFFGLMSQGVEDVPFVSSEVDVVTDGQTRTIKYMRRRLKTDERFMGTVYVFDDLTELINSKKLAAWVEMARQIAHEIKNPLTPIKLSTQFMIRAHSQKADNFDEIFEEGSQQIIHQVEVLRRIASEFSSFGRLQELNPVTHDVAKQIREIVEPYERNTNGIRVSVDAPSSPLNAIVDPEALRKICTNLIENAMEAMPEGGELHVVAGNAAQAGTDSVWITFTDSGPGLSAEVQSRLFEPYFSTKTTGTGLGLAICRTLSREMGGDVVVRNLGEGGGVEAKIMLQKA
jgi:two-component system nitrogen regulation sensor histidine kinase NtrY